MEDKIDTVTIEIPLMIRLFEYAKEDAKDDMQLHSMTERMVKLSKSKKSLTMNDYNNIIMVNNKSLNESLVIKKMSGDINNPLFFMSTDGVIVGGLELKKISDDTYNIIDFMTRDDVNPIQVITESIRRIMAKNTNIRTITIQTNSNNESFWSKATNNQQIKNNLYAFYKNGHL